MKQGVIGPVVQVAPAAAGEYAVGTVGAMRSGAAEVVSRALGSPPAGVAAAAAPVAVEPAVAGAKGSQGSPA